MRNQIQRPRLASIRGNSLVAVIIMLAVIGGGVYGLNRHKQELGREAYAYATVTAERLLFAHDPKYLARNFSPVAALDFPPSRQDILIAKLIEAREPARPITFEGEVRFESYFFSPSADFHAHLLFAGGPGNLALKISHPGDRWQIDSISVNWNFSGVH